MAEDLSPWETPQDAPAPRRRTTWGTPGAAATPVDRSQGPVPEEQPAVATPVWTQIVPDPAPVPSRGTADDGEATDYPFGVAPTWPIPAADGADDTTSPEPVPVPTPEEPVHDPANEVTIPAPDAAVEQPGEPPADAPDPVDPEPENLPAQVAVFSAPALRPAADLPAPADDLSTMFDETPVPAAAADHTPAPVSDTTPVAYHSPADQLAAMRAAHEQREQVTAEQAAARAHEATLTNRYASATRLRDVVDRILSLAQLGNPHVQGVINSFVLTRDAALDAAQRATYEELMLPLMTANHVHVETPADHQVVLDLAYDELIGVGPLGPLWRDDAVTEIIVSGPEKVICERDGQLVATPVRFRDLEHLRQTARDLAQRVDDRSASRNNPIVTAQLPGARVQFALAPVAPVAGVSITIRKFRPLFGMADLLSFGALSPDMADFLSDAVRARATILVSGGTGTGKTTMINALSEFIPDSERVITIEDALELTLSNTHVEQLLTKELASGDDRVIIGQDELLRATLRMRPDRIIVGEIRDGKGCATMLQAANTGHDGTMTTVHANNPDRALRRLTMLLRSQESMSDEVAAEEVSMAFDLIVQVVKSRGRKFVSAISVVDKATHTTRPVFTGALGAGDAQPRFTRVGGIGADTDLGQRFADAGLDLSTWE